MNGQHYKILDFLNNDWKLKKYYHFWTFKHRNYDLRGNQNNC